MFCVFATNISSTLIAHVCDRLTYTYVRDNTFARNPNQIGPTNHQNNLQAADQGLSDQQNELLKIPLNAVRISLLSFLPLMILLILLLVIGDNVISPITKIQTGTMTISIIQSLKIIIILTCLHIKQPKQIKQKYCKPKEEQTGRNRKDCMPSKLNNYANKRLIMLIHLDFNHPPPQQQHKVRNHCPLSEIRDKV